MTSFVSSFSLDCIYDIYNGVYEKTSRVQQGLKTPRLNTIDYNMYFWFAAEPHVSTNRTLGRCLKNLSAIFSLRRT